MSSRIRTVTVDCTAWQPQVAFWSQVLGWSEDPDDPNGDGDPMGLIVAPDRSIGLLFIPVPEAKSVKNRWHLDVSPTDRTRDEEVERLLGLGATQVADFRTTDGTGWVTMADPDGNEFCVLRSDAERATTP